MMADPGWQRFLEESGKAGYLIAQRNHLLTWAGFCPKPPGR
jgi:hypothetical protein